MVRFIILFIIGIISCSCGYNTVPKYVRQNFIYCYDGMATGIDTLINIEGYYDFIPENCLSCYLRVMFYKDGTYVASSYYPRDESMQSHFENITNHDSKGLYYFYLYKDWGRYIINGDTIKLQAIVRPVRGSTSVAWWLHEVWYKILDRNTIIGIYPSKKPVRYPDDLEENNYIRKYSIPAKFTPLTVRPNPNCWLKEEKWFWCNEEDWEEYKRQVKK